jgi:hypothetical protein
MNNGNEKSKPKPKNLPQGEPVLLPKPTGTYFHNGDGDIGTIGRRTAHPVTVRPRLSELEDGDGKTGWDLDGPFGMRLMERKRAVSSRQWKR